MSWWDTAPMWQCCLAIFGMCTLVGIPVAFIFICSGVDVDGRL